MERPNHPPNKYPKLNLVGQKPGDRKRPRVKIDTYLYQEITNRRQAGARRGKERVRGGGAASTDIPVTMVGKKGNVSHEDYRATLIAVKAARLDVY